MHIEIPFIGQVETQEQTDWINAINSIAKKFRLVPLDAVPADQLPQVEIAVVASPQPEKLMSLPNLKWIQSLWAGVEDILSSGIDPDISIVRLKDPQMAESMAEAVLAWTLYLHRNMPLYKRQQTRKIWQQHSLSTPQTCNVTVFGLGKLGSRAALRLKQNNFTVRGWSNSEKSIDGIDTCYGTDGFESVLPVTDIAVLLLPLTENTTGLFNKSCLLKLPTGASMINFSRGPIVVETDLLDCLDSKNLDHAVLDVFNEEPLPAGNLLWSHPDITVLPHISAPTTLSSAAAITAENIDNYLNSKTIPASVDRSRGY